MFAALEQAGRLDGVLVAPHGATVSEVIRDVDGHWLSELRRRVRPALPILGTLDPHANLSPQMVAATNALVAYRTNPHLDQRTRGVEAATLMARTLRGEIRPTQAAMFPPLAINIERQLTSEPHCRPLYELADAQLGRPKVLSNSILLGFPYAESKRSDRRPGGHESIHRGSPGIRRRAGRRLWRHRDQFAGQLISIDEALERAALLMVRFACSIWETMSAGVHQPNSTHRARHPVGTEFVQHSLFVRPTAVQQAARQESRADPDVCRRPDRSADGRALPGRGSPYRGLYAGTIPRTTTRHGGFTDCDQGSDSRRAW